MSAKRTAKSGGRGPRGAKSRPKGEADAVTLTPRQRRALAVIRQAVVDDDDELLATVDKDVFQALLQKKAIELPKIQRPAVKGTVKPQALRRALVAVEKERAKTKAISNG